MLLSDECHHLSEIALIRLCQDVMILDQSVIFGVPDLHDRHRDMRLDVDNMSYEVRVHVVTLVPSSLYQNTLLNVVVQIFRNY